MRVTKAELEKRRREADIERDLYMRAFRDAVSHQIVWFDTVRDGKDRYRCGVSSLTSPSGPLFYIEFHSSTVKQPPCCEVRDLEKLWAEINRAPEAEWSRWFHGPVQKARDMMFKAWEAERQVRDGAA